MILFSNSFYGNSKKTLYFTQYYSRSASGLTHLWFMFGFILVIFWESYLFDFTCDVHLKMMNLFETSTHKCKCILEPVDSIRGVYYGQLFAIVITTYVYNRLIYGITSGFHSTIQLTIGWSLVVWLDMWQYFSEFRKAVRMLSRLGRLCACWSSYY